MCGFAGFISKRSYSSEELLVEMTRSVKHRGPDAEGFYFNQEHGVGLGHQRLSIIDLDPRANQPMTSKDGRYTIVYNGELYNYQEIRVQLEKKGHQFKTTSDTEVLLESFALWEKDALEQWNGMFAIALYDHHERSLKLIRDRLGIKPLFYYSDNSQIFFGSELKSLNKPISMLGLPYNDHAISDYLRFGFIPSPDTIFSNVHKLQPGHYLDWSWERNELSTYWDPGNKIELLPSTDPEEAGKNFEQLLMDSVKKRLVADVPLGTFLSGGVDSSLVTACASRLMSNRVKTFSIGFKDARFDESAYARKVSDHLATDHHEYILDEKEAIALYQEIIPTYDEPFADTSAIPTMLVSRLARDDVKVILTGDGGDELFQGYGAYHWANRLHQIPHGLHTVIRYILSLGNNRHKRAARMFSKNGNVQEHIFSQEQYLFTERELQALFGVDFHSGVFEEFNFLRPLNPAELQAYFDMVRYLPDDLLTKVDRASMKYGLECRTPLLDHRLVEFSLNLAYPLKVQNGSTKWLMREFLHKMVPKELFDRPKWGFSIPLDKWLRGELKGLIHEYLYDKLPDFLSKTTVNKLISEYLSGRSFHYNRVNALIILSMWIDQFKTETKGEETSRRTLSHL